MVAPATSFESVRTITGWKRPGRDHGCKPCQIIPGVWTAHYHDIDSVEKLKAATATAPITLVVNTAPCQCEAREGFWGPNVKVMAVDLEDDPDERKYFDQGKQCQSKCAEPDLPLTKRCAGDAMKDFDAVVSAIDACLASGGQALVHCHASLSRSVAFLLAYLMKSRGMTLLGAIKHMKLRWDATWPCDRFVLQLIEYETHLAMPYRFSTVSLAALCAANVAVGVAIGMFLYR